MTEEPSPLSTEVVVDAVAKEISKRKRRRTRRRRRKRRPRRVGFRLPRPCRVGVCKPDICCRRIPFRKLRTRYVHGFSFNTVCNFPQTSTLSVQIRILSTQKDSQRGPRKLLTKLPSTMLIDLIYIIIYRGRFQSERHFSIMPCLSLINLKMLLITMRQF